MTALTLLYISLAGGLGAVCRYVCDSTIAKTSALPVAIMLINISGSLVAGLVAGSLTSFFPEPYGLIVTVGFLGGFTTFSSASVHTAEFVMQRKWRQALITGIGQMLASIIAAMVGFALSVTLW